MKILHIVANPFFVDRGGLVRIYEEIRQAHARGHTCHVCCYHFGRDVPEAIIHRIPNVPWYRKLEATASPHRFYLDIMLMLKAMRVAKRVRPDVLHAHGHEGVFAALTAARRYGAPVLMDAQGSLTGEMRAKGFRGAGAFAAVEGRLDRLADHIVCSSQPVLDEMRDRFRVPPDRLTLLADGADVHFFSPRPPSRELARKIGVPDDARVVAYLGLLLRHQGADLLLDIAQQVLAVMPDAYFLVMGFPDEAYWAGEARRRGLTRMRFTGRVEYGQAPDMLALAEVAISPKRFGSGEGNGKLLNYMAMGLPVVAFDDPVNRAILGDQGCMVESENVAQFAERIVHLLRHQASAREMGDALRSRACTKFSMEASAQRLLSVYEGLAHA